MIDVAEDNPDIDQDHHFQIPRTSKTVLAFVRICWH